MAEIGNGPAVWQVLADLTDSHGQQPEWWTNERAALHRWLERKDPELASIYQGGVLMAMNRSFPGRVRFVAHAIRELRNRLPDAIAGPVAPKRTEYSKLTKQIHLRWVDDGLPQNGSLPSAISSTSLIGGAERYEVSAELLTAVAELIAGHISGEGRNKENVRRLFEAIGGSDPPSYVVSNWLKGTRWAVKFAHVWNKPLPPDADDELTDRFIEFELVLLAISKRSYDNLNVLDQLLKEANAR